MKVPVHLWSDRNFIYPRDDEGYAWFRRYDTLVRTPVRQGVNTTLIGYEDHPRCNHIKSNSDFPLAYFKNETILYIVASNLEPKSWTSNPCEYDDEGTLLPVAPPRNDQRRFASDHCAIVVEF